MGRCTLHRSSGCDTCGAAAGAPLWMCAPKSCNAAYTATWSGSTRVAAAAPWLPSPPQPVRTTTPAARAATATAAPKEVVASKTMEEEEKGNPVDETIAEKFDQGIPPEAGGGVALSEAEEHMSPPEAEGAVCLSEAEGEELKDDSSTRPSRSSSAPIGFLNCEGSPVATAVGAMLATTTRDCPGLASIL